MTSEHVATALEAYERKDWGRAFAGLSAADSAGEASAADLDRLGVVAYLLGREEESSRSWERAHQAFLQVGEHGSAARCAFELGMTYMDRGEMAHAGGWLARAARIVEESGLDCPERGYVRVPEALQLLEGGEAAVAKEVCDDIGVIAQRFGDPDLVALSNLGRGQALVRLGRFAEGAAQLDEAMISVTADEVSPVVSGIIYCAVIATCQEMFDLARAREWTGALTRWCESQPDLVPFRGSCQVYRAEILQFHGEWQRAIDEVREAERRLAGPPGHPAIALAYYRQGELHRLRGALSDADDAFRKTEEWGRRPEPGRALLRLAQRRGDAAATAIRHALDETPGDVQRAPLLAAAVEIFVGSGDVAAAGEAADELASFAGGRASPLLRALAGHAQGAVLLASGQPAKAVTELRAALSLWQSLDVPYECARTRVLLGKAARLSGDPDMAATQMEIAQQVFTELGATTDLRAMQEHGGADDAASHGLTQRELEVLRLIATGMTNRAIAANLTISEKTAANHVGNILGKLGLSSRAAATAYAYEHNLL